MSRSTSRGPSCAGCRCSAPPRRRWRQARSSPDAGADRSVEPAPSAPTVVLVHGAWEPPSSWTAVAAQLRERGYPVLVPDNPLRNALGRRRSDRRRPEGRRGTDRPRRPLLRRPVITAPPPAPERQGARLRRRLRSRPRRERPRAGPARPGSLLPVAIVPVPFVQPGGSLGVDVLRQPAAVPRRVRPGRRPATAAAMAAAQRPVTLAALMEQAPRRRGGRSRRGTSSPGTTARSRPRRSASWQRGASRHRRGRVLARGPGRTPRRRDEPHPRRRRHRRRAIFAGADAGRDGAAGVAGHAACSAIRSGRRRAAPRSAARVSYTLDVPARVRSRSSGPLVDAGSAGAASRAPRAITAAAAARCS